MLNLAHAQEGPKLVDYEATYKYASDSMGPLNMVLLQEVNAWCVCEGEYNACA